jgi:broad specificity phosphatase PhoE
MHSILLYTHLSPSQRNLSFNDKRSGKVHLVRHAEGLHLLYDDTGIPDAPLTQRGFGFAEDLGRRLIEEHSNAVGLVISSPLRRTIQTSLTAFYRVLSSDLYPQNSGRGVRKGVQLELDANLQEIDDIPCNNGSASADLASQFPELTTQIQSLDPHWNIKSGPQSPLPPPALRKVQILERVEHVLTALDGSKEHDVVIVAHRGVINFSHQMQTLTWRNGRPSV